MIHTTGCCPLPLRSRLRYCCHRLCHAAFSTMPHTLASLDQGHVCRPRTLTLSTIRTPRVGFAGDEDVRRQLVFSDAAPCNLLEIDRRFRGTTLMMEAVNTLETSANFYQTIRRSTSVDSHIRSQSSMKGRLKYISVKLTNLCQEWSRISDTCIIHALMSFLYAVWNLFQDIRYVHKAYIGCNSYKL
jgi:hypothetical protein